MLRGCEHVAAPILLFSDRILVTMSRYLHLNPPFRAEHIGSLLRPAKVLQKRIDHGAQKCTAEELHAVEDESISAVVRLQQDLGLKTITDGEMRR